MLTLWLVHTQVVSQLKGVRLELRELKSHFLLLGACTSCPMIRSDLDACAIEIKYLKHQISHSSCYSVLSPLCDVCGSLKGKLFHATKEKTELVQEVSYLTSHLERTFVGEKLIENDLSRVEESETKSTSNLGVGFERCEDKGVKTTPKFIPRSNYHKDEKTIKSNPKPAFNPKRDVKKESPKPRKEGFVCMFCGHAGHLDQFCFHRKRIEKRCFDYARNSYHEEFTDFPPHSYPHASPRTSSGALSYFSHELNHRSYGFGS
jgi:hypothetical protein